ncbi:MAG: hypothetical protein LBS09_03075 [Bacteroidales bacterium]|nr:hypothetical protein [Bacteroidales bacterium]
MPKKRNEQIQGAGNASKTHNQVGQEVRKTIERVGGILPENQSNRIKVLKKFKFTGFPPTAIIPQSP